ncbi:hypothetical protein [Tolypothrix sp. VBCCA 56010]|uniref:hypothetical protein n=1 Tax=Tolypothrix sp. VBCCA 56010 TaxID=3137731 RepID=UPI003D7D8CA3
MPCGEFLTLNAIALVGENWRSPDQAKWFIDDLSRDQQTSRDILVMVLAKLDLHLK